MLRDRQIKTATYICYWYGAIAVKNTGFVGLFTGQLKIGQPGRAQVRVTPELTDAMQLTLCSWTQINCSLNGLRREKMQSSLQKRINQEPDLF